MTISTYSELVVTAGAYSGHNEAVAMMPLLLGLAEGKLNRNLRTASQETNATLNVVNGTVTVPTDLLEIRDVRVAGRGNLRSMAMSDLDDVTTGGYPAGFLITGNQLRIRPAQSATLTVTYYAKIPPLTPANPTNWLLQADPNVYLYALVEEIGVWAKDGELATAARQQKEDALMGIRSVDNARRFNLGRVVIGGWTP